MTCLLSVYAVFIVFVGVVFLSCLVIVLNEGQTCAVCNLSREHEYDLLLSHFGCKVDNALNILYSITVAEAVSQTAILE